MTAQFKHIMLMVGNVPAAVKFYTEGLGLGLKMASPNWAELDADGTTIALHAAGGEMPTGSSPILSFHVSDLEATMKALEAHGAQLEGRVREPAFGKVAAMRAPDGHLLSLLQPSSVGVAP